MNSTMQYSVSSSGDMCVLINWSAAFFALRLQHKKKKHFCALHCTLYVNKHVFNLSSREFKQYEWWKKQKKFVKKDANFGYQEIYDNQ